ncbi:signal peptidase I [Helicobacter trogontum]|uniref:Signal peptidase I n=1 Tax=Helicobacter trogontum TaxID=50960 RepID=A0A4U8SC23_9HELI|nr:signal peptidase I [Helicobacter trogontum]TLD83629.1 signal peptidase I [Helicobacter trogontum]
MKFLKLIGNFVSSWTGAIVIVLCLVFFVAQGFIIPSRSMVGSLHEGDMMFVKKYSYGITIPKIPWLEIPILPDFHGNRHIIEGDRPKRGDIVVFNPPGDDKTYYVKRNFAVGGDKVVFAKDGMYLRPFEGDSYIDTHFKDYETREFFNERYVKEPYAKEYIGIHYGEKDYKTIPFQSYDLMYHRARIGGTNNALPNGNGVAMELIYEGGEEVFYKEINSDSFFMVGDNRDNSEDSRFWGVVDYSRIVGQPWFTYFSITLTDSVESEASEPINRYKVRWQRMFKGIESLQKEAQKFEGEVRPYDL